MRVKRAIAHGALLWILIFFEVSVLMFGFGLDEGAVYYTIHYILLAIMAAAVGVLYFRGKDTGQGFLEGLAVGLVFLVIGVILDAAITVPLFIKDYGFFLNPWMITGLMESVLVVALAGKIKE